ncbi:hypothetical protein [Cellulomonas sp. KRMCY2]|uniref:hypothetical protein n=1 Tax=Cellulomonas sp. KRMCY2 TaxID=1304865 RepID=UPI00045EC67C|nr:hypothetical protein [Cellulomonas sp. KRMCY2]
MTTRELAILALAVGFGVWVLSVKGLRKSLRDALRASASPAILGTLAALGIWLAGVIYFADRIGLWDTSLMPDTVLWVLGSTFATIFAALDAQKADHYFRRAALSALGVTAALQFWLNVYTFNFFVELVLQAALIALTALVTFAARDTKNAPARRFFEAILAIIVALVVLATVRGMIATRSEIDWDHTLKAFAFSLWLPLAVLPFIYGLALVFAYEAILKRMTKPVFGHNAPRHARAAVVLRLGGDIRTVYDLASYPRELRAISQADSFTKAWELVRVYRRKRARTRQQPAVRAARLARFAGVKGTSPDGRQLDRREMAETMAALRWLHTCHLGNYRQGNRFRRDMLTVIGDFERHGLPAPHGIEMRIRKDGQAWYAWRRTVAGHVLAIGARAKNGNPDEWLYSGDDPPRSWPGSDPAWGDRAYLTPADWLDD